MNNTRYGNNDNISQDLALLNLIISSQGSNLLIDCIAENAGQTANKFKMNEKDRKTLINSLLLEFSQALSERI